VAAVVALVIEGVRDDDVKPFGPVQLYVAPVMIDAMRLRVEPAQIGLLLVAVGADGIELTVTLVVPGVLVQVPTVAVTEYVPDAAVVAFDIEGFWSDDVKPLGPVQLYEAPVISDANRFRVDPAQTGPLFVAVGAESAEVTVTGSELAVALCPQLFTALTVIFPF
jgi:hypothetical protein